MRQRVIATLGRFEDLQQNGQLEGLPRSGARFPGKAILVEAVASGEARARARRDGLGRRWRSNAEGRDWVSRRRR